MNDVILLDSITDLRAENRGLVCVSGSHGGLYPAAIASRGGLRAVVLNDAGMGLESAGVAGLRALDQVGMAGVAVSSESSEIGSAKDALDQGVISFVNENAGALGLTVGRALSDQIGALGPAPMPHGTLPAVPEARWSEAVGQTDVLCVDSASLIRPEDAGKIIVTGSHGGLIGGDPARACKADARLVAFNDAGGGKNDIGFSRLPALEGRDIAAVTLDCRSCRIGDAQSSLETGILSAVNAPAVALGLHVEMTLKAAFEQIA